MMALPQRLLSPILREQSLLIGMLPAAVLRRFWPARSQRGA